MKLTAEEQQEVIDKSKARWDGLQVGDYAYHTDFSGEGEILKKDDHSMTVALDGGRMIMQKSKWLSLELDQANLQKSIREYFSIK